MLEEVTRASGIREGETRQQPLGDGSRGGEERTSPLSGWLERPLGQWVVLNWETTAWILLLILAAVSRFYDVGARAMSHDESLHANYSYVLYSQGRYEHTPMMHGPFLFHMNAFVYFLFGATDATTRLAPALAGLGVVAMAWAFRRYMGRLAALLAGLFLTISPSLLFHSRYIRNDIYIAFFAMLWIYGLFRYLEDRRKKWLVLLTVGMALSFATKENAFMAGALFGAFVAGLAVWRMVTYQERLRFSPAADLAVLMLTLVTPFTAPFGYLLFGWEPFDWTVMAGITNQDIIRWGGLVLASTAIALAIGYFWFGRRPARAEGASTEEDEAPLISLSTWGSLMLLFWAVQIVLFTTFFTNPLNGLATGIVGSLGYWLAQQEVQRGSQPWYYYFLLGGIYEYMPMLLSLAGLGAVIRWIGVKGWDPVPAGQQVPLALDGSPGPDAKTNGRRAQEKASKGKRNRDLDYQRPITARQLRVYFVVFLAWWAVSAWLAYTAAGERMPWLLTHMAQPMAIFSGWWLGSFLGLLDRDVLGKGRAYGLLLVLPGLLFALYLLATSRPFQGRELVRLAGTMRWIFALLAGAGLFALAWRWGRELGRATARRLIVAGGVLVLTLLTVRVAYMLTYVNYDYATEYLVYAHATPDIKRALREIDKISERTVGDREIRVAYDNDTSWPMTWYMRLFPNSIYYGDNPEIGGAMTAPVILVGSANYDKVEPYVARDYVARNYRLIWWPDENYKGLTWDRIKGALTDPEWRSRLWQIWFYRRHPHLKLSEWPHRHEFRMYVKRDIARVVWDLNVTPLESRAEQIIPSDYRELELAATAVYSGVYDRLPLAQPRALAVGPDGRRVIADTGNNRIVILDRDGNFLRAFGSFCKMAEGAASGCVDPDGGGPLQLGDGQFWEPWGVAVGPDGRIYVADTWNGRIQMFDPEGNFLDKWGFFAAANPDSPGGDPFALFGPRGLAMDLEGNLLVADTGNKRIMRFDPDGRYLDQVGGGGFILGRFQEPTDVAVNPVTGEIFVADSWNQRIQKLSPSLEPLEEWPVPGWESREIFDKPFLAVDSNGTVYASDPEFYQVYVYSAGGKLQAAFGRYGAGPDQFAKPNGLAVDPESDAVLVADADNNRVMVFPPVTE